MKESMLNAVTIIAMLISAVISFVIIRCIVKKGIIQSIMLIIISFIISCVIIGGGLYGIGEKVVSFTLPKHIKYLEQAKELEKSDPFINMESFIDGDYETYKRESENIKNIPNQIVELINKSLNKKFSDEGVEYASRYIGEEILLMEEYRLDVIESNEKDEVQKRLNEQEEIVNKHLDILKKGLDEKQKKTTLASIYAYASEHASLNFSYPEYMIAQVMFFDIAKDLEYENLNELEEIVQDSLKRNGTTIDNVRELINQPSDNIANNEKKEESSTIVESESIEEDSKYSSDDKAKLNKEKYIQKLNSIEEEVSTLSYDGSTVEMKETSSMVLKKWDDALNEIYGVLKTQLSSSEMESLREEQREWIVIRDAGAEESASEFEGGSMYDLEYTEALSRQTKERCYELVEIYMK